MLELKLSSLNKSVAKSKCSRIQFNSTVNSVQRDANYSKCSRGMLLLSLCVRVCVRVCLSVYLLLTFPKGSLVTVLREMIVSINVFFAYYYPL